MGPGLLVTVESKALRRIVLILPLNHHADVLLIFHSAARGFQAQSLRKVNEHGMLQDQVLAQLMHTERICAGSYVAKDACHFRVPQRQNSAVAIEDGLRCCRAENTDDG